MMTLQNYPILSKDDYPLIHEIQGGELPEIQHLQVPNLPPNTKAVIVRVKLKNVSTTPIMQFELGDIDTAPMFYRENIQPGEVVISTVFTTINPAGIIYIAGRTNVNVHLDIRLVASFK